MKYTTESSSSLQKYYILIVLYCLNALEKQINIIWFDIRSSNAFKIEILL